VLSGLFVVFSNAANSLRRILMGMALPPLLARFLRQNVELFAPRRLMLLFGLPLL
jgi:hypothetical protein